MRSSRVEVYHLIEDHYELVPANERGHYPINALGVELGIWSGRYQNVELPWLRWWDEQGNLLLTGEERAAQAELLLEQELQQRELAEQRVEQLAQKLREMGVNLDE